MPDIKPYEWLDEDDPGGLDDQRPLPEIVAERWGFPMQRYIVDHEPYYAVQDWIAGLTSANPTTIWADIKRRSESWPQLLDSIQQLGYTASDGKKYAMDFATDKGLYLIAQHLRVTKQRPLLAAIKDYLAKAGAFTDQARRDAEVIGTLTEHHAGRFKRMGRSDSWIEVRLEGIVTRKQFVTALRSAVIDAAPSLYRDSTEKLYKGLLDRTTAQLRGELHLPARANPRDHMGEYALVYIGLTERICRDKLNDAETVRFRQALEIIWEVAKLIRQQYLATQAALGRDLLTDKPLLPPGE